MDKVANLETIRELNQQLQKIEQQKKKEVAKEIKAIVKSMKALDITVTDLTAAGANVKHSAGRKKAKKASPVAKVKKIGKPGRKKKPEAKGADGRSAVKPKYKDPNSDSTWTGRGKAPNWIIEYEKKGQMRAQFLIKE